MPAAHDLDNASRVENAHVLGVYVAPSQPANPLILTERPNVVAARIARQRRDLSRIMERHGTANREWLASVLRHQSTAYAQRCLDGRGRAVFSEEHLRTLGIDDASFAAWRAGDERRAA